MESFAEQPRDQLGAAGELGVVGREGDGIGETRWGSVKAVIS
jgi:hypothetical protein